MGPLMSFQWVVGVIFGFVFGGLFGWLCATLRRCTEILEAEKSTRAGRVEVETAWREMSALRAVVADVRAQRKEVFKEIEEIERRGSAA